MEESISAGFVDGESEKMESISNSRFKLRRILSRTRVGTCVLRLLKFHDEKYSRLLVSKDTDICIEGYPRSANSFAYHLFSKWNPGLKIGRHLHIPQQLVRSVRFKVPIIVLIRQPLEAVSSLAIGLPNVEVEELLGMYVDFYRCALEYKEECVFSSFDTTTQNFSLAVEQLNDKHLSKFVHASINEEESNTIFEGLREHSKRIGWESMTSAPDQLRDPLKSEFKEGIILNQRYAECVAIYNEVIPLAV